MRKIAAALLFLLTAALPAAGQTSLSASGLSSTDEIKIRTAAAYATFAGFCEWRSLAWGQDYLIFIVQEAASLSRVSGVASGLVIAAKDAAALEIQSGDLRGNCARRYNPAILAEMERARGAGQIPSLVGLR